MAATPTTAVRITSSVHQMSAKEPKPQLARAGDEVAAEVEQGVDEGAVERARAAEHTHGEHTADEEGIADLQKDAPTDPASRLTRCSAPNIAEERSTAITLPRRPVPVLPSRKGEDERAEGGLFKQPDADAFDGEEQGADGVGDARRAREEGDEREVIDGDDQRGQAEQPIGAAAAGSQTRRTPICRASSATHAEKDEPQDADPQHIGVVGAIGKNSSPSQRVGSSASPAASR